MASCLKIAGWTIASIVVIGALVGTPTWAVLASKRLKSPGLVQQDWWEHTVIYQIYTRSFKDSDGDGIGDLNGITSKLQYFVGAGVGAIWLSPIFASPMVDFGYDVSNFYEIHHEYGTMADFEELMERAHELGIKVILDHVPNHASTESVYFQCSEARTPGYENFFVWADPRPDPNNSTNRLVPSNWISQFGGSIWQWSEIRQQFYLHQFAVEQADFNFREPAVKEEMHKIMRYWLEKGVDGFRIDAAPHLIEAAPDENGTYPDEPLSGNCLLTPAQPGYTTKIYVRDVIELYDVFYEWREYIDQLQEENSWDTRLLLAEAFANISMTMLYYGDEASRSGAHFPFNFDIVDHLSVDSNARDFAYVIKRWLTYMPLGKVPNWVLGNHDNHRVASRFRRDMVDGLNCLLLMLPGVAVTYQGEEIGMRDGYVSWSDTRDVVALNQGNSETYMKYSRDPERTPYQWDSTTSAGFSTNTSSWLPVARDYLEINLAAQKLAPKSHFKVYQAMTSLRQQPALSHGQYHIQALTKHTLVLVRHLGTYDTYTLVLNVGNQADTVDLSRIASLSGSMEVYASSVHSDRENGSSLTLGEITLQAGEALVLKSAPV